MTLSTKLLPNQRSDQLRATGSGVVEIDILKSKQLHVKSLYLSYNSISNLKNIGQFQNLEILLIQFNCLSKIEDLLPLQNLNKLRSLRIEGNPITNLPLYEVHTFYICKSLEKLDTKTLEECYKNLYKTKDLYDMVPREESYLNCCFILSAAMTYLTSHMTNSLSDYQAFDDFTHSIRFANHHKKPESYFTNLQKKVSNLRKSVLDLLSEFSCDRKEANRLSTLDLQNPIMISKSILKIFGITTKISDFDPNMLNTSSIRMDISTDDDDSPEGNNYFQDSFNTYSKIDISEEEEDINTKDIPILAKSQKLINSPINFQKSSQNTTPIKNNTESTTFDYLPKSNLKNNNISEQFSPKSILKNRNSPSTPSKQTKTVSIVNFNKLNQVLVEHPSQIIEIKAKPQNIIANVSFEEEEDLLKSEDSIDENLIKSMNSQSEKNLTFLSSGDLSDNGNSEQNEEKIIYKQKEEKTKITPKINTNKNKITEDLTKKQKIVNEYNMNEEDFGISIEEEDDIEYYQPVIMNSKKTIQNSPNSQLISPKSKESIVSESNRSYPSPYKSTYITSSIGAENSSEYSPKIKNSKESIVSDQNKSYSSPSKSTYNTSSITTDYSPENTFRIKNSKESTVSRQNQNNPSPNKFSNNRSSNKSNNTTNYSSKIKNPKESTVSRQNQYSSSPSKSMYNNSGIKTENLSDYSYKIQKSKESIISGQSRSNPSPSKSMYNTSNGKTDYSSEYSFKIQKSKVIHSKFDHDAQYSSPEKVKSYLNQSKSIEEENQNFSDERSLIRSDDEENEQDTSIQSRQFFENTSPIEKNKISPRFTKTTQLTNTSPAKYNSSYDSPLKQRLITPIKNNSPKSVKDGSNKQRNSLNKSYSPKEQKFSENLQNISLQSPEKAEEQQLSAVNSSVIYSTERKLSNDQIISEKSPKSQIIDSKPNISIIEDISEPDDAKYPNENLLVVSNLGDSEEDEEFMNNYFISDDHYEVRKNLAEAIKELKTKYEFSTADENQRPSPRETTNTGKKETNTYQSPIIQRYFEEESNDEEEIAENEVNLYLNNNENIIEEEESINEDKNNISEKNSIEEVSSYINSNKINLEEEESLNEKENNISEKNPIEEVSSYLNSNKIKIEEEESLNERENNNIKKNSIEEVSSYTNIDKINLEEEESLNEEKNNNLEKISVYEDNLDTNNNEDNIYEEESINEKENNFVVKNSLNDIENNTFNEEYEEYSQYSDLLITEQEKDDSSDIKKTVATLNEKLSNVSNIIDQIKSIEMDSSEFNHQINSKVDNDSLSIDSYAYSDTDVIFSPPKPLQLKHEKIIMVSEPSLSLMDSLDDEDEERNQRKPISKHNRREKQNNQIKISQKLSPVVQKQFQTEQLSFDIKPELQIKPLTKEIQKEPQNLPETKQIEKEPPKKPTPKKIPNFSDEENPFERLKKRFLAIVSDISPLKHREPTLNQDDINVIEDLENYSQHNSPIKQNSEEDKIKEEINTKTDKISQKNSEKPKNNEFNKIKTQNIESPKDSYNINRDTQKEPQKPKISSNKIIQIQISDEKPSDNELIANKPISKEKTPLINHDSEEKPFNYVDPHMYDVDSSPLYELLRKLDDVVDDAELKIKHEPTILPIKGPLHYFFIWRQKLSIRRKSFNSQSKQKVENKNEDEEDTPMSARERYLLMMQIRAQRKFNEAMKEENERMLEETDR